MYEHFKDAEPGFLTDLVIPKSAETARSVAAKTRESVIGLFDGVPIVNLASKFARAVI